jgi:hypothetical protein
MFENERHQGPRLIIAFHSTGRERGGGNNLAVQWILALRGLVLMAAPKLYERAAMSMEAIPLVRLVFGVNRRDWALSHLCGLGLHHHRQRPMRPTMPGEPQFSDFHKDCVARR